MSKNKTKQDDKKKLLTKKNGDVKETKKQSGNGNQEASSGKNIKSSTSDGGKVRVGNAKKPDDKKQIAPPNELRVKKSEVDALNILNKFNTRLNFIKRLNAHPCLALDIDSDKISYLTVKKYGPNIQVEKCGTQNLDPGIDRFKTIQLELAKLKSRIHKRGMKVYVSFDSPDINIRQIIIPKTKKKSDLKNAVFFKNQNDLPNFDNKSIWNYQILDEFSAEGTKKLKVLVTAIPYEVVRMFMEILISVGLRPEKLVPKPLAVSTAYNSMIPDADNDLVVVISSFFTQIYYFRNGKLQFFRNAALGVSNIQKAMEEKSNGSLPAKEEPKKLSIGKKSVLDLDLSTSIKERLLKKVEESKAEESSVIKMLYTEIKRSIDYINLTYPTEMIKRTFVTGSGIQVKEIMSYLQKQFDDSLVTLKPQFSSTEINTSRYSEYFTALGAALQVGKEFDTIPTQYKASRVYKNANILLITILFLSIGGAASFSSFQKYDYVRKQNALAHLGQQYQVLNPIQTKYDELIFQYGMVQKDKNELLGFLKKTPKLLEVLRLFSNETPPFIILNELKFAEYIPPKAIKNNKTLSAKSTYEYRITLAGEIKSDFQMGDVILINFMNQLNDLNYFEEIKLTNKRKEMNKGLFEFWLEFHL